MQVVNFFGTWLFYNAHDVKLQGTAEGIWDAPLGLVERFSKYLPGFEHSQGFTLSFSEVPFSGFRAEWIFVSEEIDGKRYKDIVNHCEDIICHEFFRYFDEVPAKLFVKLKP